MIAHLVVTVVGDLLLEVVGVLVVLVVGVLVVLVVGVAEVAIVDGHVIVAVRHRLRIGVVVLAVLAGLVRAGRRGGPARPRGVPV